MHLIGECTLSDHSAGGGLLTNQQEGGCSCCATVQEALIWGAEQLMNHSFFCVELNQKQPRAVPVTQLRISKQ